MRKHQKIVYKYQGVFQFFKKKKKKKNKLNKSNITKKKIKLALVLLFCAPFALAVDMSSCVRSCLSESATSVGCSSLQDVKCVCSKESFVGKSAGCLEKNCSQNEFQEALGLQSSMCM
jgi:hypothetical protein